MAIIQDIFRITDKSDNEVYFYSSIEDAENNFGRLDSDLFTVEVGTWTKTGNWTQESEILEDEGDS